MKTAINWLEEQIELIPFNSPEAQDFYEECMVVIKKAKEMEKEQIKDSWLNSLTKGEYNSAEEYYNETFNK